MSLVVVIMAIMAAYVQHMHTLFEGVILFFVRSSCRSETTYTHTHYKNTFIKFDFFSHFHVKPQISISALMSPLKELIIRLIIKTENHFKLEILRMLCNTLTDVPAE